MMGEKTIFDKPFTTIEEQIGILKSRGMIISDEDRAKRYLERIGYFRLSGYYYPLRVPRIPPAEIGSAPATATVPEDRFVEGASFNDVIDLYVFDKKLRLLFLDAIERIEVALRSIIANRLGKRSPWAYLDRSQFHVSWIGTGVDRQGNPTPAGYDRWIESVNKAFNNSKDDFAKHFRSKYSNNPPIWELIEVWDFGMLSHLYAGLGDHDKYAVSMKFGISKHKDMRSWIRMLNNVRNICAHHGRLWNRNIADAPSLPAAADVPLLAHLTDVFRINPRPRIYPCAAIAKHLLDAINPTSTWGERFVEHIETFPRAEGLSLSQMQFPDDWQANEIWAPKKKKAILKQHSSVANLP